jgi:hypothetical protein
MFPDGAYMLAQNSRVIVVPDGIEYGPVARGALEPEGHCFS